MCRPDNDYRNDHRHEQYLQIYSVIHFPVPVSPHTAGPQSIPKRTPTPVSQHGRVLVVGWQEALTGIMYVEKTTNITTNLFITNGAHS